jgi:predicted enzyme related to lactoylglutathione lyase
VEELGGATILPRTETPVGGIAVVRDPDGAPFAFFDGENEP